MIIKQVSQNLSNVAKFANLEAEVLETHTPRAASLDLSWDPETQLRSQSCMARAFTGGTTPKATGCF